VFSVWNITKGLFILCVVLLPFAEWRIFSLPLHGRKLGIDWTGYRSASAFDFVYFLFLILLLSCLWRFIKERRFVSHYMLFWIPAIVLIPVLYLYLWPHFPYLTPSQKNVIDARSFITHLSVAVGVTVFLSYIDLEKIVRGSYVYYSGAMVCFVILSLVALSESSVFYFNYPFATPFTISFPFPSQNVAAPFITICLIGIIGAAVVSDRKGVLFLAIPIGILAAALTGSRSNMLLAIGSLSIFPMCYMAGYLRGGKKTKRAMVISLAMGLAAAGMTVGLVVLAYDWQPVRRSLSVFGNFLEDPIGLVMGIRGSPRWELWSQSLSGEKLERKDKVQRYKMYVMSIEDGRVAKGKAITDLEAGRKYYVRLRGRRTSDNRNVGVLEVFSDKKRHHLVAKSAASGRTGALRSTFLFVSDTGGKRGLVTISASLDNYAIRGGDNKEISFTFSDDEELKWYEQWYYEKYGDSKGVIRSDQKELRLVAYEQQVSAYVDKPNVLDVNDLLYTLEYELFVDNLDADWPITGPARFYVGFHDGNPALEDGQWEEVRNGLLIAHEHIMSHYKWKVLQERRWFRLAESIRLGELRGEPQEIVRQIRDSQNRGKARVAELWESEITQEDIRQAKGYRFGGRIVGPWSSDLISVVPDETWSAEADLAKKGSTHNVYLDWYYYVGKIPFALFVLFIVLLVGMMTEFVWKRRNSPYAGFYLATWLQIMVVVVAMYAHPGIWIKYIWFLFGMAGGIMLSGKKCKE